MRILFDHQTFSIQNFGGISRYIVELIKGVNRTPGQQANLPILFSNNIHLREAELPTRSFWPNTNFHKKQSALYRLNQWFSCVELRRQKFDVLHATYFDPYFIPFLRNKPFVVTFHDMVFEKFNTQFNELGSSAFIIKQKKRMAEQATRIITVSEHTKKDVVELLHIDPDKIDVVYHGSSFAVSSTIQPRYALPYLLFVGNRGHYKNFLRFLRASTAILLTYGIELICAGGGPFTDSEWELIRQLGLTLHVSQRAIVADEALRRLYGSALAFVFPSLYEGFGIPVLEAFACNCPCVLSNTSSLPEVAGSAALYFDPTNDESIAGALEQIIVNADLRYQLINRGRERLMSFSWEQTVRETLNVYQRCLRE